MALEDKQPGLVQFINTAKDDQLARRLPLDAFILSPVQRLARYPLLVQAILGATRKGFCCLFLFLLFYFVCLG